MSKKTITLTESQLREIVKETLTRVLQEKPLLTEMALPRKTYKERIRGLSCQLLENWCLVRYCSLIGQEQYKKHWSDELRGHMLSMSRLSMKGNDSIEARKKVFEEVWDDEDYNNPQLLTMVIANKFINEGIDVNSESVTRSIMDCINAKNDIIGVILLRDINKITQYVQSL